MNRQSCLGDDCKKRSTCMLHHLITKPDTIPHNRVCQPGETTEFEPIPIYRPAGTWEGISQPVRAVTSVFDLGNFLTTTGATNAQHSHP